MLYNIEPLNSHLRVEEPRADYSVSAPADSKIPETQLRELRARLAHHRANPNERKYSLSEIMADRLSLAH